MLTGNFSQQLSLEPDAINPCGCWKFRDGKKTGHPCSEISTGSCFLHNVGYTSLLVRNVTKAVRLKIFLAKLKL